MILDWLRSNVPILTSVGIAGGASTPTVWAIQANLDGPEALPWSLVAVFVICLLTGALITLPQHKRELKREAAINERLLLQNEKFIDNFAVIIKLLEDIQSGGHRSVNGPRQRQDRR